MIGSSKLVRLGDVARYINGRGFKPSEWGKTGIPIIRIQNLNNDNAPFNYFDGEISESHLVQNGDLLVSWSASLDAFIWKKDNAALNQHIFKVVEDQKVIDRTYLYYALREVMQEIRDQTHGATMKHINKAEFEAVEIPLPSLPEQKRIATILTEQLTAVEKARKASEARLEAARALPAAYLRRVFESEEAKEWSWTTLENVAQLLPSKSIANDGDTTVTAITTACLTENGFDINGLKTAKMWKQDAKACQVQAGEILIARSNTPDLVGRISIYKGTPQDIVASDLTIRILPYEHIVSDFLGYFMSYLFTVGYWRDNAGGASGTMKKITRTQVLAKKVPIPNRDAQLKLTEYLDSKMSYVNQLTTKITLEVNNISLLSTSFLRQAFSTPL